MIDVVAIAGIIVALVIGVPSLYLYSRQAKAGEKSNAIAEKSYNDEHKPDVRWSQLNLFYLSIYDGGNAFKAVVRNYSSMPITIHKTKFSSTFNGLYVPFNPVKDVHGVLATEEEMEALIEFKFPDGAGDAVYKGTAKIIIVCRADFTFENGRQGNSIATFEFDRQDYRFRLCPQDDDVAR